MSISLSCAGKIGCFKGGNETNLDKVRVGSWGVAFAQELRGK
jgi:hypothetical protein